ncbi:ABC transporter permease [Extensimonas sp. H3M7-6]|nr:ABC transporter permease [Extensimonas sp. H3M7-6]MDF1482634.1 ABC transporter permease [Extensimonas sp. H3M7-6]
MRTTECTLGREAATLWRARALLRELVRREVAARYAGTAAGVLWAYLQPLLSVAAYYLVFDVVFGMRVGAASAGNGATHAVGTFLIVGALPWMAFCDAVTRGMNSLVEAGGLLQKNPLPPVLIVARSVLASALVYGPLLCLVALLYAPLHRFGLAFFVALPLLLLMQLLLSALLGFLLAIFTAALRDTAQLVGFLLSVGIYLTPVLFPWAMFPQGWRWLLWLNPATGLVLGYQSVLLQGAWPAWPQWLACAVWVAVLAGALSVALRRSRDQLVDWL